MGKICRECLTLGKMGDKYGAVVVDTSAIVVGDCSLIVDSLNVCEYLLEILRSFKGRNNFVLIESVGEELDRYFYGIRKTRNIGRHDRGLRAINKSKRKDCEKSKKETTRGLNESYRTLKSILGRLNSSQIKVDSDFFDCFFDIVSVIAEYVAENFPGCDIRKEGSWTDEEIIASAYSLAFDMRKPVALAHRDGGIRKVNNFVRRMLSGRDLIEQVDNRGTITCFLHYPVVGYTRQGNSCKFLCDSPPYLDRNFEYADDYFERLVPLASKLERLVAKN